MTTLLHACVGNALGAAVLALFAAVVARCTKRPALAHGLWLLVLLKLVAPPLIAVPMPLPTVAAAAPDAVEPPFSASDLHVITEPTADFEPVDVVAHAEPAKPLLPTIETTAAALWLTGAILWWSLALYRMRAFTRILARALPASDAVQEQVRLLADRMGLRRVPRVGFLPIAASPLLWALGRRPVMLVPTVLWARLGESQRAALLVHELAHLKRGDHWVRRLELLVLGLYWWLPVVWWARKELQEAEERCCDAWVAWTLPEAKADYASALVESVAYLSRSRSAAPLGASGMGRARDLKGRLTMILKGDVSRSLSWRGLLAVLALAALLPLTVGLAAPTLDQPPAVDDDPLAETLTTAGEDAVREYQTAEYAQAIKDLDGRIKLAESELEQQRDREAWAQRMLKNGYSTISQAKAEQSKLESLEITLRKLQDEKQALTAKADGLANRTIANRIYKQADPQRREFLVRNLVIDPDNPKQQNLIDARDVVEILQAQFGVKKAELKSAQVALPTARVRLTQAATLHSNGVMSAEDLQQAKAAVAAIEAQVAVKQAELIESEVRLKQAQRRLKAIEAAASKDGVETKRWRVVDSPKAKDESNEKTPTKPFYKAADDASKGRAVTRPVPTEEADKAKAPTNSSGATLEQQRILRLYQALLDNVRTEKGERDRTLQQKIDALQKQIDQLREELNAKSSKQ